VADSPPGTGLAMQGVSKRIGRRDVLREVSLHVERGEIVGLFGRDGAGKTLCFEAIMGLTAIDAGQILFEGRDITALTIDRRAPLGLSFLSQETSIFRGMTTAQNIAAVLELREEDEAAQAERLEHLLAQFDIAYVRDTPAMRLSGGERRRCEVARAMAQTPSIMLFDEPFAGIDPMTVNSITAVIRALKAEGVGVLVSDQNVPVMLDLIDRAYVLHEGEVIFEGTPAAMLASNRVHALYLGPEKERK